MLDDMIDYLMNEIEQTENTLEELKARADILIKEAYNGDLFMEDI